MAAISGHDAHFFTFFFTYETQLVMRLIIVIVLIWTEAPNGVLLKVITYNLLTFQKCNINTKQPILQAKVQILYKKLCSKYFLLYNIYIHYCVNLFNKYLLCTDYY